VRTGDVGDLGELVLRSFEPRDLGRDRLVVAALEDALADADRDVRWIERALDRKQPVAALVLLADADRLIGGAVDSSRTCTSSSERFSSTTMKDRAGRRILELALGKRPRARDL